MGSARLVALLAEDGANLLIVENIEDPHRFALLIPITQVADINIIAWFLEGDAVVAGVQELRVLELRIHRRVVALTVLKTKTKAQTPPATSQLASPWPAKSSGALFLYSHLSAPSSCLGGDIRRYVVLFSVDGILGGKGGRVEMGRAYRVRTMLR